MYMGRLPPKNHPPTNSSPRGPRERPGALGRLAAAALPPGLRAPGRALRWPRPGGAAGAAAVAEGARKAGENRGKTGKNGEKMENKWRKNGENQRKNGENREQMEKIRGKMGKTGKKWRKYGEKWGKQGNHGENPRETWGDI